MTLIYRDFLAMLGIGFDRKILEQFVLKPHQVQFLAWAKAMKEFGLKGRILADDIELEKTIAALSHVVMKYRRLSDDEVTPRPISNVNVDRLLQMTKRTMIRSPHCL